MTLSDIAHQRLFNHHITNPAFETPEDVVSHIGAIQAQDYFGSLWSIGLRMKNPSEAMIEEAIDEKKIVRTWPMRGTLHCVMPQQVRWMLKHLAPRVLKRMEPIVRQSGLDKKDIIKGSKAVEKALSRGEPLTRPELYDVLKKNKIDTDQYRGIYVLGNMAMEGLVCLGPRKGKQPTYVLLDDWLPSYKMLTKDEALATLAKQYFAGHGPATQADFAWWTGITLAEAKQAIEDAKDKLEETVTDDVVYYTVETEATFKKSSACFLLPGFDEYVLSYADRSAVADATTLKKITGAKNGLLSSTIIINGKAIGTWKRTLKKDTVEIQTTPFDKFTTQQKTAMATAAKRYGNFLGLKIKLV